MAIETIPNPATVPTVPDDYEKQNDKATASGKGYCAVSLTNWDTSTTIPDVIIGSVIETNDVFYRVITANETPSISGLSAGTAYLYFDGSGFLFSNTAPTWSATLNGWYNSTDRFTGHYCEWDGASAYTLKQQLLPNNIGPTIASVGALELPGSTIQGSQYFPGLKSKDMTIERSLSAYAFKTDNAGGASSPAYRFTRLGGTLDASGGIGPVGHLLDFGVDNIIGICGVLESSAGATVVSADSVGTFTINPTTGGNYSYASSATYANYTISYTIIIGLFSPFSWPV